MAQYCRYCGNCVYGDALYCLEKEIVLSNEQVKHTNKCKHYAFIGMDVFDDSKNYRPRRKKKCNIQQSKLEL